MRLIRSNFLNPVDPDQALLHLDYVLGWSDNRISVFEKFDSQRHTSYEDRLDCLAIPGLIDIHVHLSQYRIRGMYEPALLTWLDKYVFPEEALSADNDFAHRLSVTFFQAMFSVGTTTSVIYTSPFYNACVEAFDTARQLGARALIGMTMMDQNCPESLQQQTESSVAQSIELYHRYHNESPLLDYIFTPRFALTCSKDLMKATAKFANEQNAWMQTHLSENRDEVMQTLKAFGASSYTELYDEVGMLGSHSIFAHAIHLSPAELDRHAAKDCRIAHCPDSNFFLKSGEFPYPEFESRGIDIGIGSDVGAGTSLNMLYHAKMAAFRQSEYSIKPERLFYHITLGNAKALHMEDIIGSFAIGKEADICMLKVPSTLPTNPEEVASLLCYVGCEYTVKETVIAGRSVYTRRD